MSGWGRKKLMASLGVDEAAMAAFERERADRKNVKYFGVTNFAVTDSWIYQDAFLGPVLLPLREVASFTKGYREGVGDSYAMFYVRLLFKNGAKYELGCEFKELDRLMALLAERCPQVDR